MFLPSSETQKFWVVFMSNNFLSIVFNSLNLLIVLIHVYPNWSTNLSAFLRWKNISALFQHVFFSFLFMFANYAQIEQKNKRMETHLLGFSLHTSPYSDRLTRPGEYHTFWITVGPPLKSLSILVLLTKIKPTFQFHSCQLLKKMNTVKILWCTVVKSFFWIIFKQLYDQNICLLYDK